MKNKNITNSNISAINQINIKQENLEKYNLNKHLLNKNLQSNPKNKIAINNFNVNTNNFNVNTNNLLDLSFINNPKLKGNIISKEIQDDINKTVTQEIISDLRTQFNEITKSKNNNIINCLNFNNSSVNTNSSTVTTNTSGSFNNKSKNKKIKQGSQNKKKKFYNINFNNKTPPPERNNSQITTQYKQQYKYNYTCINSRNHSNEKDKQDIDINYTSNNKVKKKYFETEHLSVDSLSMEDMNKQSIPIGTIGIKNKECECNKEEINKYKNDIKSLVQLVEFLKNVITVYRELYIKSITNYKLKYEKENKTLKDKVDFLLKNNNELKHSILKIFTCVSLYENKIQNEKNKTNQILSKMLIENIFLRQVCQNTDLIQPAPIINNNVNNNNDNSDNNQIKKKLPHITGSFTTSEHFLKQKQQQEIIDKLNLTYIHFDSSFNPQPHNSMVKHNNNNNGNSLSPITRSFSNKNHSYTNTTHKLIINPSIKTHYTNKKH